MSHSSTHAAPLSHSRRNARPGAGYLSLARLLLVGLCQFAFAYAHPFLSSHNDDLQTREGEAAENEAERWMFLSIGIALVLIGGVFAGLTIALMGQDEIYLKVIAVSGEGSEQKNAKKVLTLLQKGKHWVLVTLLVGNVVVNETLPLVLDRSLGGGFAAAIISTVLVIVFGEIIPQSACVRYGLPIGAWTATPVFIVMCISAPITWPIAKLLDWILGEDHGTTYKKAGLKTLVTLHNTMKTKDGERLNEDEVLIISSVLDLKAKPVGIIMTPMHDVFTLSADDVLNEELMDQIVQEGYSRIPVHHPRNRRDFVGMLLVKMLITYDPEDCAKVKDFALATLPETRPETSCLDIINFFQQGKSHMVLVSDFPGEAKGALGVVTLEDVIEELIGEEIIDESDVYVDVHKAIRRMAPAPTHRHRGRASKGEIITEAMSKEETTVEEDLMDMDGQVKENGREIPTIKDPLNRITSASFEISRSPTSKFRGTLMRRTSSTGSPAEYKTPITPSTTVWKDQFGKLGPSNAASHPRYTSINTVKVKQPAGPDATDNTSEQLKDPSEIQLSPRISFAGQDGVGSDRVSSGHGAKDGVQAVQMSQAERRSASTTYHSTSQNRSTGVQAGTSNESADPVGSHSTLDSLHNIPGGAWQPKPVARSGSIREDFVEGSGGVRKMVLELTSSSENEDDSTSSDSTPADESKGQRSKKQSGSEGDLSASAKAESSKKSQKRKSRKSKKEDPPRESTDGTNLDESTPLLQDSKGKSS